MEYEADPQVLNRGESRSKAARLTSVAGSLLANLVNFGTMAVAHTRSSNKAATDPDFPVMASFLHLLEMCDAIEVLLREGCAAASVPLARSMFEALLTTEYIAESESEARSAAWWVGYLHSSRRLLKGYDHRTSEGKRFLKLIKDDKNLTGWARTPADTYDRFYASTDKALTQSQYVDAAKEYEAVRARAGGNPAWYSLYAGPANLRDLAIYLRRGGQYDMLYRQWSDIVHPQNLSRWMEKDSGFPPRVTAIRDQKLLPDIAFHAANITLEGLSVISNYYDDLDASLFVPDASLLDAWLRLKTWSSSGGPRQDRS